MNRVTMLRIVSLCIISALCGIGAICMSFIPQIDHSLSRANRYEGVYVFIQSQPVADYTVLGTVKKTGFVMSGDPTEMFETLVKRCKKQYDDADGIIFDDVKMEHATCIKFK